MTPAEASTGTMRPDTWTRDGESGLMARLVALQLVAGQQLESVTAVHGLALGDVVADGLLDVMVRAGADACNIRVHAPGISPDQVRAQIVALTEVVARLRVLLDQARQRNGRPPL